MLRIAVQAKGRLFEETMALLEESDIKLSTTLLPNAVQSFVIRRLPTLPMGKISLPATSQNIFLPKRRNMNKIYKII